MEEVVEIFSSYAIDQSSGKHWRTVPVSCLQWSEDVHHNDIEVTGHLSA